MLSSRHQHILETFVAVFFAMGVTCLTIELSFQSNGLEALGKHDFKKVGWLPLVCFADGAVLGMTLWLLCINLISIFIGDRLSQLKGVVEDYAGVFALYSIFVGIPVLFWRWANIPIFQAVLYVFCFVSNVQYAIRFFTKSEAEGGQ